ncbi:hypothetical protein [Nevskia sp.]|uniref:hypothetical protein n=1 Tax=Nevskia sp. TaxID=1929292 RepID=UPI0025DC540A|nr:hypothetical protein [Nevskia sp.]
MDSFTAFVETLVLSASGLALASTAVFAVFDTVTDTRIAESARSNILGVTGMPRDELAAMFRRDGLFGRDSQLTPAEQAVVQAALPRIVGLKPLAIASSKTPLLAALADYVSTLVVAGPAVSERQRLETAGLSEAAINEVATVVDNVRVVFQPTPQVVVAEPPAIRYQRAA